MQYSYYAGQVFSPPSGGKQGLISFNISNNLEMKFKDKNDSIRKVSLIDDLSMGISYTTAAQVVWPFRSLVGIWYVVQLDREQ